MNHTNAFTTPNRFGGPATPNRPGAFGAPSRATPAPARTATDNLAQLNAALPAPTEPAGSHVPWRLAGNMLFLAATPPRLPNGIVTFGKVGQALTIDQGYEAARTCGLNLLVNMRAALGTLDRVDTVLKVFGMVNAAPNFIEHGKIIDGCTDLFVQVFGDNGRPARSAIGMGSLPGNVSVEIEAVVLVR